MMVWKAEQDRSAQEAYMKWVALGDGGLRVAVVDVKGDSGEWRWVEGDGGLKLAVGGREGGSERREAVGRK